MMNSVLLVIRAATVAPTSVEGSKLSRWYAVYSPSSKLVAKTSNTGITFHIVGTQDLKWHGLVSVSITYSSIPENAQ